MKLVECVPNFSEGRDKKVIEEIVNAIKEVEDVKVLDVDPGMETNRTVVTFVGSPEGVKEAAFRAIKKAAELIDMRKHKGAHPRMGATDVCPFVPVSGVTMEECVEIAKEVGRRVGEELGIPVYLYEEAATSEQRRSLAVIREGEYEGLEQKIKMPEWKPDFGPSEFNPKAGATVIGAREFLIAYNINLNTKDKKLAHKVALNIREKGKLKRDENGKVVRDENGNPVRVPGRLKAVRAIGWYIPEYGLAQISVNLINYKITPLYKLYEVAKEEAEKLGLRVIGSELVGLIPKRAILETGKYYLLQQGKSTGIPEKEIIDVAVLSLGLNSIKPFIPEEKIIEYAVEKDRDLLVRRRLNDFVDELSSDSPAPGGGSASALAGALSASLGSMVANLTIGKKDYREVKEKMNSAAEKAQEIKDRLMKLLDEDTEAFNQVMKAMKTKGIEKEEKEKLVKKAMERAIEVPINIIKEGIRLIPILNFIAEKGNKNSISDAGVGALLLLASIKGAYHNVLINTITDMKEKREEVEKLLRLHIPEIEEIINKVESYLK